MKDETIIELYRQLNSCAHNTKEQQKLLGEFCDMHLELEKMLSESARESLDKLLDKNGELNVQAEMNAFVRGFKLGMKIAIEVLSD